MSFNGLSRTALVAAVVSLSAGARAYAQHEGHQMAGAAGATAPERVAICSQNAQAVTAALDASNTRIEDVRQSNNPAAMRAAIGDLQVALAQMKEQLAECLKLGASTPAGGMAAMAGMDHSGMAMPSAAPPVQHAAPTPASGAVAAGGVMDHSPMEHPAMGGMSPATTSQQPKVQADTGDVSISFRSDPAPPRAGDNDFEVTLTDRRGTPIVDADVSLAFYMPPMPSMNMPAMRNTVKLAAAGAGRYNGGGTIGMAGEWQMTITATRKGQPLGVKKLRVTAK